MVNSDRAMPCWSIGHTSRSLHPPVRSNSKFFRRSIRLSMLACNSHLREKLKSPKRSLREDISPPRYTANNEKCSESQPGSASGALCLAPFRTLTHALPVFMEVIYQSPIDTQRLCPDRQKSGKVRELRPRKQLRGLRREFSEDTFTIACIFLAV